MDENKTVPKYFVEIKMQPKDNVKLYPELPEAPSTVRPNKHNNVALMVKCSISY